MVFLLDTATAQSFGCYGNDRDVTPFMDEMAKSGVRYENAFANSIYSLPSYASIFTGEYPTEHGAIDWDSRIKDNKLVEGLNDNGYSTIALSNHLISNTYGFGQEFDVLEFVEKGERRPFPDDDLINELDDGTAMERWDSTSDKYRYFLKESIKRKSFKSLLNGAHDLKQKFKRKCGFWSDQGAKEGLAMAREQVKNADEPFFLFLNFIEPHFSYEPPKGYIMKFMPDDVSFSEINDALDHQLLNASVGHEEISDRHEMILRRLHEAEIRYVDDKLEEFYHDLDEDVRDNTVFVFLSDHGDLFGKEGIWGHRGRVYNEVANVPLIINYPWSTEPKVKDDPAELRQLCQHFIDLSEGEKNVLEPNGEALIEYYGLDTQQSFAPWEEFDDVDEEDWNNYQAGYISSDMHKLIWDSNGREQLFDLKKDFGETNNLAQENPNKLEELEDRIKDKIGFPKNLHSKYRETKELENVDL